jgi:uncharacterized membrane protein YkvA (DUF1232 family)
MLSICPPGINSYRDYATIGPRAGPAGGRSDMSNDMDFSRFDSTTRRIAEQLAGEALVSPKVLADELRQYVETLDSHRANAEFVDDDVAKRIAALCWQLLKALPDDPDERQHRLTQLAINYFVLAEDAHDDNHSLAGFEDDLEVVTAVVEALGLNYLLEK